MLTGLQGLIVGTRFKRESVNRRRVIAGRSDMPGPSVFG